MDLHLAPNSTQFFSMCRAKTLAQNRSVFGNAEVNVDVRYSLLAACQVKSKPNQQNCKMRYERSTDSLLRTACSTDSQLTPHLGQLIGQ